MSVDIPNYRVLEKLGEGAETKIYRARCMRTGKDYAVKIIKVVRPEHTGFIDLLRSEHAIGSSIDHPIIRKVYELRILRQRLRVRGAILFMEYVPGIPMSAREFHRSLPELLALFKVVAEGLYEMHRAGYVHADLKPNNIMVTPEDEIKLIDLGQSSKIREAKAKIQGTIDYMAPEQAQRGILDERTDVFGLGAALHRVVTGKAVQTEMNQNLDIHSQGLVGKRVSQIQKPTMEDLPLSIGRLINDCCQADPVNRLRDMPTLIERIKLVQTVIDRQAEQGEIMDDDPEHDLEDEREAARGEMVDGALDEALAEALGLGGDEDEPLDIESLDGLPEED